MAPVDRSGRRAHTCRVYSERRSRVPGGVVWTAAARGRDVRVLPDGCIDLIWAADGRLFVAGPDTRAHIHESGPDERLTGLRFGPGTAPSILGVPAHLLRDRRVPLVDLWGQAAGEELRDRLAAGQAPDRALERAALARMRDDHEAPRLAAMVRLLRAGRDVARVADLVGFSERQLHRRSLDAFGYGPKTLARILRLTRALALARRGVPFADTALRSGYADQAHLARDVRDLAGVPLRELTR
jgi:AraC-like DNA-binding protein